MMWSESTIILAIVGMVGLFSTAIIWQRSNRITSRYYGTRISYSISNQKRRKRSE